MCFHKIIKRIFFFPSHYGITVTSISWAHMTTKFRYCNSATVFPAFSMIPMLTNKNQLIFDSCQIIYSFWESKNMYTSTAAVFLEKWFSNNGPSGTDKWTIFGLQKWKNSAVLFIKSLMAKAQENLQEVLVVTQVNPLKNLGNHYFKFTHSVQVGTRKINTDQ